MISIERYLLLIILWLAWCGLHSVLISIPVTNALERLLGVNFRFYRLIYNLISIVTLIAPVSVSLSVQRSETALFAWSGMFEMVRYLLIATALFLFVSGGKHYDIRYFLGISQVCTRRTSHLLNDHNVFTVSGISAIIRHPWYLGGILMIWSLPEEFFTSTVITAAILSGYFLVGTILEERKLVKHFGETYRAYQQDVSMLFPLKWFKRLFFHNNK
jgi:protein-S-isoprenylcysteine O-methyltransferase Ste14